MITIIIIHNNIINLWHNGVMVSISANKAGNPGSIPASVTC